MNSELMALGLFTKFLVQMPLDTGNLTALEPSFINVPHSSFITGMSDEDVLNKMKVWSDLSDPSMVIFIKNGFKALIRLQPTPPSWKVNILNHKTKTTSPFMGYMRYSRNSFQELIGIEIIIFPVDKMEYAF